MICWPRVVSASLVLLSINAAGDETCPSAATGSVSRTMTEVGGSFKDSLTQAQKDELRSIAEKIVADGKGILAADESTEQVFGDYSRFLQSLAELSAISSTIYQTNSGEYFLRLHFYF
ncbi:hypothetical protein OESDEN_13058 [Oesophagostomum dentatum]|uniref:fructose-bisphosphate aldolase n=1 Tax=Oesophagostomum dentatum TaxID=61180 RepID=A0A0B1SQH2_OESDE|nr:hypothetical protein OESDEN_13058 [Oesophagostomum dentatum]